MRSVADMTKLEWLANFLINERGYVVVALKYGEYQIGQIVHLLWNVKVEQPLRVIAFTDRDDWREQSKIASKATDKEFQKAFYVSRESSDAELFEGFYRLITD
jgi:hypothetical protein